MAFRFRLQPLLDYRASREEEARLSLAREVAQLERQRRALASLGLRRQEVLAALERAKGEVMPAGRLALYFETVAGLEAAAETQARTVAAQERLVEEARRRWAAARRDLRVMERLRERAFSAWRTAERRREEREMDELVVLRFGRNDTSIAGPLIGFRRGGGP